VGRAALLGVDVKNGASGASGMMQFLGPLPFHRDQEFLTKGGEIHDLRSSRTDVYYRVPDWDYLCARLPPAVLFTGKSYIPDLRDISTFLSEYAMITCLNYDFGQDRNA
jgi:hypothetical protein